ncbi:glycosyltransferase family 2 protein, partial [Bacillus sp. JJ1474]
MMPKVSVIMGVLNSQETISKAIESIVSQTFKDWEFIICDDGST